MASQRVTWLLRFLTSAQGLLTITASAAAGLAVGLLPNLAQAVPEVGGHLWWLAVVAVAAVLVFAVSATLLHGKEGVGIVVIVSERGWDVTRLRALRADALQRHPSCFTVNVSELLGSQEQDPGDAHDRVRFAHRVLQARILEAEQPYENVSLYVTARHHDAYRLGELLRDQRHTSLRLMRQSHEDGVGIFEALRLHSDLTRQPDTKDLQTLRDVLARDPETDGPEWLSFDRPDGDAARRIALILPMAGHLAGTREKALAAARAGQHDEYLLTGSPADREHCVGALIFATRSGNVPDRRDVYEALVRYVHHHWNLKVTEMLATQGTALRGWIFTDGPTEIALTLGYLLGRQSDLVPWRRESS
ncbi:hypothetical protein FHX78_116246 [Streptomyces capillispiralis]|uniref:Uncharacterized protein n=1 Tax=Streptomyces capillispiralis TaxID=68182 RepID=A0A561TQ09_9ACTN|nr:hypothetical protein FHX78_116246 [Streptomyces capillispiralis]